jgi:anti-anti-sigma factor
MSFIHPLDPIKPSRDGGADGFEPLGNGGTERAEPFELRMEPMGEGWIRVSVEGELALASAAELERAVERQLLAGRNVLLDFSQVAFMDSFGLRAMTGLVRAAKGNSRELKLSSDMPAHARRLMEIVGLLPFAPIAGAQSGPADSDEK